MPLSESELEKWEQTRDLNSELIEAIDQYISGEFTEHHFADPNPSANSEVA